MPFTQDTFQIYQDLFHTGRWERITQFINALNAASGGTIVATSEVQIGNYAQRSFTKLPTGTVYRDPNSTAAATDIDLTQDEVVSVKVLKGYGPFKKSRDAWAQMGSTQEEMSFNLGQQFADVQVQDWLNTGILACYAALSQHTASPNLVVDITGTAPGHGTLNTANALLGDASARILAYVMQGKTNHDIVGGAISDNIPDIAAFAVVNGATAFLGRQAVVTDAPALLDTVPVPDEYRTLGLTQGAIEIVESEPPRVVFDVITGEVNLADRFQAEYAFNVSIKGHKWNIATGGAAPDAAALALSSNWDQVATSEKDLPGVAIRSA